MTPPAASARPARAVVVINGDDVYEDLFSAGLRLQEIVTGLGFATRTVMGTARLGEPADLIVLYTAMGYFPPARQAALAGVVSAGTGLLAVHASNVFPAADGKLDEAYRQAFELIGCRYVSHGPRPHESRFRVEFAPGHMLAPDRGPFEITHEHYQVELAPGAEVVAWRPAGAGPEPIAVVREHGRGRVCYLQLGHDMRAFDDPQVRTLITRAALWATGEKEAVAV